LRRNGDALIQLALRSAGHDKYHCRTFRPACSAVHRIAAAARLAAGQVVRSTLPHQRPCLIRRPVTFNFPPIFFVRRKPTMLGGAVSRRSASTPVASRACPNSATLMGRTRKSRSSSGITSFRTQRVSGRDLYCAFVARYVQDGCLDALQAAHAWTGTQAFLRAASEGFERARGRGFALPHVTLGVRAGRSNNGAKCTREAGNAVAVAHLAAARVPQSSAAGTQAPRFSEG
jgi:hypothetical protein